MRYPRTVAGRAATVMVAALVGAVLAAALLPGRTASEGVAARGSQLTRPAEDLRSGPAAGASTVRRERAARPPGRHAAVPRLLSVPRVGLRMPVVPRGVDHTGAMELPATPFTVAWYRFGPRPSDRAGATVLAGHVDTAAEGAGPLAGLDTVREGDLVEVRAGDRVVVYRTTTVTRVSKALIDLPAVFSRVGRPRLHLVTCGGAYLPERGGYQDNVVLVADRVSPGAVG